MTANSLTWFSFLPFIITIVVATSGWMFTYFHARHQSEKRAQLDLVDKKLRLLYGPLYARLLAGNAAWKEFSATCWPKHGQEVYFADGYELPEEELATWRHWMTCVFHPMNKKFEAIIFDHIDLIEGDEVPKVFTDALTHIHVYEAVIKKWEVGDFSQHKTGTSWPSDELMKAVEPAYHSLRAKQAELLGSHRQ